MKEQQKRIGTAEFRNTQFSYTLGKDGVEKFVVTPELQSEDHVGRDPLPPGQVWGISPGGQDEGSGLYRIEVTEGPGSGVRILNRPAPPAFAESGQVRRGRTCTPGPAELVGDRNPREHEFSVQLRAYDASKSGQLARRGRPAGDVQRPDQQEPAGRAGRRRRPQPRRLASTRCTTPSTWSNLRSRREPRSC